MRVLTVVDALKLGGAETLIAQLGRVSADAGIELSVLSLHGRSPERSKLEPLLRESGVEPEYLDVRRTLDVSGFRRLVGYLKQTKPDIVHAHLEMAMTMAIPAARRAGIPAVGTFHHVHRPLSGRASGRERLAVEIATRSAAAIFVSQASLVSFADRYRRSKPVPASWTVVHNGIDLDYFTPAPDGGVTALPAGLGAGLDPTGNGPVVTILAALRDFKGITHAIDAWPAVLAEQPTARLLLVGSGEQEPALRAQVARLGLTGSVVFAGMRSDVPEVLRGSDLVVLPSIYGENLPTVLMEAGGCGRPVVASDVGGISDIVADGETGLLVPPGDSPGIAAAILRLLADPDLRERMGQAGRRRMERLFDARLWARSLHVVYQKAIDTSGRVAVTA
ncbi:glycosyltransferase family 4 protein [Nakamurella sp.]|uniref:glycosyltransferase family 4 protein n=1 Tax=Nakamurella sp. TaxID=1869182 RepID=UPI003783E0EF